MSSKLIEALIKADILISIATFEEGVRMDNVDKIRSEIRAAISAPLRNCDVGTAEEQFDRHETFCEKYFRYSMDNPCAKCPNYKDGDPSSPCVFRFLQMPYGEGGVR